MEKSNPRRELENISNYFITSSDEKKTRVENLFEDRGISSGRADEEFEVEERVSIRKEIEYIDTQNAQENIKRRIFAHLQDDYIISRIELRKTSDILQPKRKKRQEEEIIIILKEAQAK